MFPNILAELGRRKWTILKLSELTGIPYSTLRMKLNGDSPTSVEEACRIKRAFGSSYSIEHLFLPMMSEISINIEIEVIKFESFRRSPVGYRSQLSTAGRRSGFLRVQAGKVDYEFIERTGGLNMIDKMINWLWLFVFITMIIAVVEKLSCVRF